MKTQIEISENDQVFKYCRLYTGPDGESHFQDVEIQLSQSEGIGVRSETIAASGFFFRVAGGKSNPNRQNALRRQFVVLIEGTFEVMVAKNTKRRFKTGDILLAEDVTGRGHITTSVDNKPWKAVFIPLD